MTTNNIISFTQKDLSGLLDKCKDVRVGVIGDFCLDAYLFIDMSAAETSQETMLQTRPVVKQRYELGGAGNVVGNIVAIGCRRIEVFGFAGLDPWGYEMQRLLKDIDVNTDGLLLQDENWATPVYVKPHKDNVETNRLDFGCFNKLSNQAVDRLIQALHNRLDALDVVVVNQQLTRGIHTDYMRSLLGKTIEENPEKTFVVDCRHFSDAYPGAYLKISDHEAADKFGIEYPADALVLKEDAQSAAERLFKKIGRPVFVSRGARGVIVQDETGQHQIPGIQVLGKVDTVGAGDSMLAGLSLALATGASTVTAATVGNIVASIAVQKLQQTGTANPMEILGASATPDYNYRPELAEDIRQVRSISGTEFEQVREHLMTEPCTHVIFDHDGTISTLRQGWERIMEPMMIKAILGPSYSTADDSLYNMVGTHVRDFIDKSTGIQTLVQMHSLVKMVREFGCVPEDEILDEHGYKKIYNDELVQLVQSRIAKLKRGELDVQDYTLKNAVDLLQKVSKSGAKLYLASGTDEQDVIAEANALGYADLFEGRIFGAVGDMTKEAKRMVLDRILNEIGHAKGLVTFGDGPVEIRETHKRGGFTIGVASDEVRRFGINHAKRSRLIRAGADMILPDFSQLHQLLQLLHIGP